MSRCGAGTIPNVTASNPQPTRRNACLCTAKTKPARPPKEKHERIKRPKQRCCNYYYTAAVLPSPSPVAIASPEKSRAPVANEKKRPPTVSILELHADLMEGVPGVPLNSPQARRPSPTHCSSGWWSETTWSAFLCKKWKREDAEGETENTSELDERSSSRKHTHVASQRKNKRANKNGPGSFVEHGSPVFLADWRICATALAQHCWCSTSTTKNHPGTMPKQAHQ